MAWWKQAYLIASAFWSGMVCMSLWFVHNFDQLGQSVSHVQASIFALSAVLIPATAIIVANLHAAKRATQP
jgi:uncharacterized membrane protein YhaH (DUF805 family)